MKENVTMRSALTSAVLLFACSACGPVSKMDSEPSAQPVVPDVRECPSPSPGNNVRVTEATGESNGPVIGWDGDQFTVTWWDMRGRYPTVHAARLDKGGMKRSPSRALPHEGSSKFNTVAQDTFETQLVWLDEGTVMSARSSAPDNDPEKVATGDNADPAAGPLGSVAWVNKGRLLFLNDGMYPGKRNAADEDVRPLVLYKGGIEGPRIAWSGEQLAVVWSASMKGGRRIMLQRLSNDGKRLGRPVEVSVTKGASRNPEVVWTGQSFAVVWTNAAPAEENPRDSYRIFFALVPPVGNAPTLTRQLDFSGTADRVALSATGEELGLSWVGSKEPMGSAVYFHRLSNDGAPLGERVKVSDEAPFACGRPSLTWAGDGYGVTWHDDRDQVGSEVFFSFLTCGEEEEVNADAGPVDAGGDSAEGEGEKKNEAPALKAVF